MVFELRRRVNRQRLEIVRVCHRVIQQGVLLLVVVVGSEEVLFNGYRLRGYGLLWHLGVEHVLELGAAK